MVSGKRTSQRARHSWRMRRRRGSRRRGSGRGRRSGMGGGRRRLRCEKSRRCRGIIGRPQSGCLCSAVLRAGGGRHSNSDGVGAPTDTCTVDWTGFKQLSIHHSRSLAVCLPLDHALHTRTDLEGAHSQRGSQGHTEEPTSTGPNIVLHLNK